MRCKMFFVLTFLAAAVFATAVYAQDGKQQRQPNVFGSSRFLQHETVRTELGLSGEQKTQLQKLFDAAPAAGAAPKEIKMQTEEFQSKAEKILTPEQQQKYLELTFQLSGGLNNPNFGEHTFDALKLSDDQVSKIQNVLREQRQNLKNEGKQAKNLTPEQREKNNAAIQAVLTPEQLKKAETLTDGVKELRQKLGLAHNPNAKADKGDGKEHHRKAK